MYINQVTETTITQCFPLLKYHALVFKKVKYTSLMNFNFSQNMLLTLNWSISYNREKPCGENPYREKSINVLTCVKKRPTPFLGLCIKAVLDDTKYKHELFQRYVSFLIFQIYCCFTLFTI